MRKKLLIAFGLFVAVILIFVAVVAMQPSDYRVERKTSVAALPSTVFDQVNDFHKWEAWSPWARLDPNAKYSFEGPTSGEGAIFKWSGNSEVGEGQMTILESKPGELVKIKLDFIKPFEDTATSQFSFQPEGDQTVVTWSMSGKNNFIGRAFCLFMNMDKMMGEQFDKGLAGIKAVAEAEAKKEAEEFKPPESSKASEG